MMMMIMRTMSAIVAATVCAVLVLTAGQFPTATEAYVLTSENRGRTANAVAVVAGERNSIANAGAASQQPPSSSPVAAAADEASGCYHNGTVFHDGSLVPTVEPCLQCRCRRRNLVCSLRICNDLPVPPPRGCVLVQKRGVCCAYVTCSKFHKLNEIAQRRGDAGGAGGMVSRRRQPAGGGGGPNALFRGVEEDAAEQYRVEGNEKLCVVNGTIYRSGSAMTSSSLCSYCYCIAGRQKCVQPKCVLASPGCQPIYSDSTCCPIRYDCTKRNAALQAATVAEALLDADASARATVIGGTPVTSPGAGQVVHHSNKHFMRTKMRTQRSRGCIVGAHFYQEGLKMPHDPMHPCNMCFCIRGAAKCTPKKCAPAIPNCTPIVPPGQCCPASYACDHSGDSGEDRLQVASKSRQFDFLSMFFDDEPENGTTTTEQPALGSVGPAAELVTRIPPQLTSNASTESSASDSIFAAIEAGLKYIESNDDKVGTILDQTAGKNATSVAPKVTKARPQSVSTTTEKELSFLDIFLGDDEDEEENVAPVTQQKLAPLDSTTEHIFTSTPHRIEDRMSTQDYEETTVIITKYAPTLSHRISTTDAGSESTYASTPTTEYVSVLSTIPESTDPTTTNTETDTTSDTENASEADTSTTNDATTSNSSEATDSTEESSSINTSDANTESTLPEERTVTVEATTASLPTEGVKYVFASNTTSSTTLPTSASPKLPIASNATATVTPAAFKPTTENIFSALFDGISSMFNEHNGTATALNKLYKIRINTDRNATHRTPTANDNRVRNITSSTTPAPVPPTTKSHPTPIPLQEHPAMHDSDTRSPDPGPMVVQSNPSILDAELNYDYGEPPTLPPSLPNLKIIPFLPTDAVKNNRNPLHGYGGYYGTNTGRPPVHASSADADSSYSFPGDAQPVLTLDDQLQLSKESKGSLDSNEFELFHVGAQMSGGSGAGGATSGHDVARPAYPSITESIYDLNDPTRFDAETQKKLYPSYQYLLDKQKTKTTPPAGNGYDIVTDFEKFVTNYPDKVGSEMFGHDQFSPPSETQGGFVPKESLEDPYLYDTYHKTKPMIESTTGHPAILNRNNANHLATIHSDAQLDTFSLTRPIEDQHSHQSDPIDHDYSSIVLPDIEDDDSDKNIISITTDSNYRSTSEYAEAPSSVHSHHREQQTPSDYRHQSLTSLFPSIASSTSFPQTAHDHTDMRYEATSPRTSSLASLSSSSPSTSEADSDLFGSLFGFLFKDDEQLAEFNRYDQTTTTSTSTSEPSTTSTTTIPPFRKITSLVSLHDLLNFTHLPETTPAETVWTSAATQPQQRINDKLFEGIPSSTEVAVEYSTEWTTTPTSSSTSRSIDHSTSTEADQPVSLSTSSSSQLHDHSPTDLNILRDALLGSLSSSHAPSAEHSQLPSRRHPIYQAAAVPPFLSPIFHHQSSAEAGSDTQPGHFIGDGASDAGDGNPIRSDLDRLLTELGQVSERHTSASGSSAAVEALPEYSFTHGNHGNRLDPVAQSTVQTFAGGAAQIFTKPVQQLTSASSSPAVGMLKLAGCNIYGRMYRVGRIIAELSSECLECRCTEVGVNCTPLDC